MNAKDISCFNPKKVLGDKWLWTGCKRGNRVPKLDSGGQATATQPQPFIGVVLEFRTIMVMVKHNNCFIEA